MTQELTAAPQAQRVETIDALRGLALLGVLVVNLVTEFRVSIFAQFVGAAPPASTLDRLTAALVVLGAEGQRRGIAATCSGAPGGWSDSALSRSNGAGGA